MFKFAFMMCHCITKIHKAMTVLFESYFIFKSCFLSPSHSVVLQKFLRQHPVSTAVLVIFATFFQQQGMLNGKTEDWVAWFYWPRYLASYQPVSIVGAIHSCRFQMSPAVQFVCQTPTGFLMARTVRSGGPKLGCILTMSKWEGVEGGWCQ